MVSERATRSLVFAGVLGALAAVLSVADIVTQVGVLAFAGFVVLIVAAVFLVQAYAVIFMLDRDGRMIRQAVRLTEQAQKTDQTSDMEETTDE